MNIQTVWFRKIGTYELRGKVCLNQAHLYSMHRTNLIGALWTLRWLQISNTAGIYLPPISILNSFAWWLINLSVAPSCGIIKRYQCKVRVTDNRIYWKVCFCMWNVDPLIVWHHYKAVDYCRPLIQP